MHHFGHIERDRLQLEMFRLDLRIVEDVVEDHEQRFGRRSHQLERAPLLGGQFRIENQLDKAEYRVHRGADLVTHVGEEGRTRARDALGEIAGLAHHGLGALGGFLADCEARGHPQMFDQRDVRAARHHHHDQGEE